MAIASSRRNYVDVGLGCYGVNANYFVEAYLDSLTWGRSTGDCSHSMLKFKCNALQHYDTLVWASSGNFTNNTIWCWTNLGTNSISRDFPKGGSYSTWCKDAGGPGCYYTLCGGADWYWHAYHGYWEDYVYGDINTTRVGVSCQYIGMHSGDGYYNLPNDLRVLPPVGFSCTFPTAPSGNITASLTKWAENPNIGGTPTTYGGAKIWNFAANLFNEDGTFTGAGKKFNTGETLTCNLGSINSGWSTNTGVLTGSAAALAAPFTPQAGKKYYVVVCAQNNMNQEVQATSGLYTMLPEIKIKIDSCIYDPSTKKNNLTFTYTKEQDNVTTGERLRYDIYDEDTGTYIAENVEIITVYDGRGLNDQVVVPNMPTGHKLTVYLELTVDPNLNGASVSRVGDSIQAPVANAAFLGFEWDELRRTCTIRAEAPGASHCRIQAGYAANVYDIGNQLTPDSVGVLTVKDLQHGNGQIMYLQAVPESASGYQYTNEIAKVSVPIPNPILGVRVPPCESGEEKEYVVDIVEMKDNCTTTPRWQVGDRVVVKDQCPTAAIPPTPPPIAGGNVSGTLVMMDGSSSATVNTFDVDVLEGSAQAECNGAWSYLRLQRGARARVTVALTTIFPGEDFSNPNIRVVQGGSGLTKPSYPTSAPKPTMELVDYNPATKTITVELGTPADYTGEYVCWNVFIDIDIYPDFVSISNMGRMLRTEIRLGGQPTNLAINPQQYVLSVKRGDLGNDYVMGIPESYLNLTKRIT